jgi:hypothetical protein
MQGAILGRSGIRGEIQTKQRRRTIGAMSAAWTKPNQRSIQVNLPTNDEKSMHGAEKVQESKLNKRFRFI